jgi:hypothetical protein
VKVTLTNSEVLSAAIVGARREIRAIYDGQPEQLPRKLHWGGHIEGAAGELAYAKATGQYWPAYVGPLDGHDGDVGPGVEIKTQDSTTAPLTLRPPDQQKHGEATFVLVTGRIPDFVIVGRIYGPDAFLDERWEPAPADGSRPYGRWKIPQIELEPIELVGTPSP